VTPDQYIAKTPEPKRSELAQLHALIRRAVPSFEPYVAGSMIGYGKYHYRYESGREGTSCRVGLAGNKTGISVYVTCVDAGGWLAEQWRDRLGKAAVGKSCIRFKRLSDIDLGALTKILAIAKKLPAPGEVGAAAKQARTKKAASKTGGAKNATTKAVARNAGGSKLKEAASSKKPAPQRAPAKRAPVRKGSPKERRARCAPREGQVGASACGDCRLERGCRSPVPPPSLRDRRHPTAPAPPRRWRAARRRGGQTPVLRSISLRRRR